MLLKDCVLISQTVLIIYTQTILNMAQVIFAMLCHGYALTSFLHAAVIPIPKNAKLNLSSTCNYRDIALSSIFCKILDTIIMSLQSEYLMTSELQFGFK